MARYKVLVDDNFHYQDESERVLAGEYDTEEEALAVAKGIVDRSLADLYRPGMKAAELIEQYVFFGEDPFIVPTGETGRFSARDYASVRCAEICG